MSGLEGLSLAANVIAVIDLSAKVISWCYRYSKDVKNARADIEKLQQETNRLKIVAEDIRKLLEGPSGAKLTTVKRLSAAAGQAHSVLDTVDKTLSTKKGLRRFGLRALKWPYESKDVEGLLQELVRTREIFHLSLQIDQTNIIISIDERAKLDRIPVAEGASSHAGDEDATTCLPDTRVQLKQDIWEWVNSDTAKPIMWLSGSAGTGKSTISLTVSSEFEKAGILGATFFFKRTQKDRSNLSKFVPTLAADLAVKIPEACQHILDTIENQSDIFKKVIGDQLDQLIIEPITQCQAIRGQRPIVIIIDALDECEREADIRSLIQLLTRSKIAQVSYLRILLTSRPELPIRLGFSLADSESFQSFTLHDIPDEIIRKDIHTFLLFHLSKIRVEYNASDISYDRKLGPDWPGNEMTQTLLGMSVPLFIFAATVCRFIGDHVYGHPDKLLNEVLDFGTKSQESQPQLDKTYFPVVNQLIAGRSPKHQQRILQRFRLIVGSMILLATPLSKQTLAKLLGIEDDGIDHLLDGLHSVINVPSAPKSPLRLFHLSFRDFLLDLDKKDSPFWVDETKAHAHLASRSLITLDETLKQNICGIANWTTPRKDLNLEPAQIESFLSPEVQYACTYWVHHFEMAGADLVDDGQVLSFMKIHFLHWLEALSLLDQAHDCTSYIKTLQRISSPIHGKELLKFLHDAEYFTLAYTTAIDTFPLQIYWSLLGFTPKHSIFRKLYTRTMSEGFNIHAAGESEWGYCLQTLKATQANRTEHVAFSQDSALIATKDSVGGIWVWNTVNGDLVGNIKPPNHAESIAPPIISPDSSFICSTALTRSHATNQVWNIITGEQVLNTSRLSSIGGDLGTFPPPTVFIERQSESTMGIWRVEQDSPQVLGLVETRDVDNLKYTCSVDFKFIAICAHDKRERETWTQIRNLNSGTLVSAWRLERFRRVECLNFSPDSVLLAVCSLRSSRQTSRLALYDVDTGKPLETSFYGVPPYVLSVAISHDSILVATGSLSGEIHLWRTKTGDCVQTLGGYSHGVTSVVFSHDSRLLASASENNTVRLWRVAEAENNSLGERKLHKTTYAIALDKTAYTITISPDLKKIATLDDAGLCMWSADTGDCMWSYQCRISSKLLFSPNSAFVLVQESENQYKKARRIVLLHTDTGKFVHLQGQTQKNREGTFSNDSALIAFTDNNDGSAPYICICRTTTGNRVQRFECSKGDWDDWGSLTFSQDSKLIAAIGNGVLCTWDITSGQCLQQTRLKIYVYESYPSITFSPNLDWAAGISSENEFRVWNCDTGMFIHDDYVPSLDPKTFYRNYTIIFVPNSNYVVVSSFTGLIYVWDFQTGICMVRTQDLYPHHGAASFQPESSRLLVGTGAVELVNLPPNPLSSAPSSPSVALYEAIKPHRSGYGISLDYSWITWDDDNFFYLPVGYQPDKHDAIVVSGSVVFIGYQRLRKTVVFKFSSARGCKPVADIRFIDHGTSISR
ncbi:unnamed protein product [Clonostachys byssicola]|uniref:Mitochondrial division protein 1 n=1 Tax=Clonostachys byssicola TaxID=160290 RepID=A0A9N9UC74_9HYPO|nr:unnamed protein product [Clonostachys byssicola]